jgi:hypothetical protein
VTSIVLSEMSPRCHMPGSMCCFNLYSVDRHVVFFSFTSHITCQNLNCECQLTCVLFLCEFLRVKYQKLAKTLSKRHTGWNAFTTWSPFIFGCLELRGSIWPGLVINFFILFF